MVINPYPNPAIKVSPGNVQREPHVNFSFTDIQPEGAAKFYTWYMGDTSAQLKYGREVNYSYKNTGTWTVNLQVLDRNTGCSARDSVKVTVIPVPGTLYLPNAFYPNSAHPELKTFTLKGFGITEYKLQIFDAWGKLVFETTDLNPDGSPKTAWNGRYMNTGPLLPQDAYVWKIVYVKFENGRAWNGMSYNGGQSRFFGNVTLFR